MKDNSVHLVFHYGSNRNKFKLGKRNEEEQGPNESKQVKFKRLLGVSFSTKTRHIKKYCPNTRAWFENKGINYTLYFFVL